MENSCQRVSVLSAIDIVYDSQGMLASWIPPELATLLQVDLVKG